MNDRLRRFGPLGVALAATYAVACPASAPMPPDVASPAPPPGAGESARSRPERHTEIAETIYDGGLKGGWQDWGWAPRNVTGGGPATVRFDNWGGWILAKPGLEPGDYGGVLFRVKEPPGEGEFMEVRLEAANGSKFPRVKVKADERVDAGDGWIEVLVPMSELDPDGLPFEHVVFQAFRPMGQDFIPLDKIALTKGSPRPAASLDASRLPHISMTVDCRSHARRVSPGIYGIAYYQPNDDKRAAAQWLLGATARRWGGNTTSTYNWELSTWNLGNDWFFENHDVPSYKRFLDEDAAHGMASAVTVPMMGWVAKDGTSNSFPVSAMGAQQATDQWRPDAGNGKDKNGKLLTPGPPTRAYEAAPVAFVKRWVQAIRAEDAKTGKRSVSMYILDNEPALWNQNHRDAHPEPLSYDELVRRTIEYGTAIREADPDAIIAGPAEWGWTGYFYSAKDQAEGGPAARPDRRAHGDVPIVAYYLKALAEHEKKTGTRILDVFDLHAYPQGERVYSDAADPDIAALRLRQTRMLWDPTYVDETWIHEPVKLLPRMRQWVDENYPGRALSLGEWNFGAENHMSGGLAVAEALGRFAQAGLDYAYYWTYPPDGSPAMWAFRAYRNFDGKGAHFLDWFTPVSIAGGATTSLFVSRDDSGKHLVAVALNLSRKDAIDADVDLSACGKVASVQAWGYDGGRGGLASRTVAAAAGGKLSQPLAPYSITVLDVKLDDASPPVK
jgi:hypothetical protein